MKIEIYGAAWCSACKQVASYCEDNSLAYDYIDIDQKPNLQMLEERMGVKPRTIPQIFLDNTLVPGGVMGLKEKLIS